MRIALPGSAGQSFGAFLLPGVSLHLTGDANDYVRQRHVTAARSSSDPPAAAAAGT